MHSVVSSLVLAWLSSATEALHSLEGRPHWHRSNWRSDTAFGEPVSGKTRFLNDLIVHEPRNAMLDGVSDDIEHRVSRDLFSQYDKEAYSGLFLFEEQEGQIGGSFDCFCSNPGGKY